MFPAEGASKGEHALLLWKAGFISAIDITTYGGHAILSPELTWQGHELLDTIRSKAVWERIKTTAKEKGVELQIPFFMIKQSNDMISLIDGHDQRL